MTPDQMIDAFKALSTWEKFKVATIDDLLLFKEYWWLLLIIYGGGMLLIYGKDIVDYYVKKWGRKIKHYFHTENQKRRMDVIRVLTTNDKDGFLRVRGEVQAKVYSLFTNNSIYSATDKEIRRAYSILKKDITTMKGDL